MNFFSKWAKRLQWTLTPEKKKQQKMDRAIEQLKLDPQAYALLEQARADGIDIRFESTLIGAASVLARYLPSRESIEVTPNAPGTRIASYLAHELRHRWQYKKLGITKQNRLYIYKNPRLAFIFNRVIEADAYAFQFKFDKIVNETAESLAQIARDITELQKKKAVLTPEDLTRIKEDAEINFKRARLRDGRFLREKFMGMLENEKLANSYDPKNSRDLHALHTATRAKKEWFKDAPELTIAGIRSLLKAGIAEDSPDYLKDLTDRQFKAAVLRHAHKDARATMRLIEKFNKAAASNDNEAAKNLRKQVQKKVRKL